MSAIGPLPSPPMSVDAEELLEYVRANLPLASAMGVSVVVAGDESVELHFPLAPNLNHERTAFGGSLAAAGMLAAWSLIWLQTRRITPPPRLVIAESQMRFIRPVDGDFIAACDWPKADSWAQARDQLTRTGRARIELRSELQVAGKVAAAHYGTFVVIALDHHS